MNSFIARTLTVLLLAVRLLHAQAPQLITYQGRVATNGVNFDGSGEFKFALVDATGTTSYWSNDGTSFAGAEPNAAVTLTVITGQYSVLLGDTTRPNMAAIPASVFNNDGVFLRVWFNDSTNGSQLLTPDQRIPTPTAVNARGVRGGSTGAATDCWEGRDKGTPPAGCAGHTAVWTGSEMIVWGGSGVDTGSLNTGGRYHPVSNNWTAVSTNGAPGARYYHTAVWTGSEMVVWGGYDDSESDDFVFNDGGRYDPVANSWTAVPADGAPAARYHHTVVWTGSEMIVWGGVDQEVPLGDGGRYNPAANSWTAVDTTSSPVARHYHTAVWTGSEMIVWGGTRNSGPNNSEFGDGGRYDPMSNKWMMVSPTGAPSARFSHTAVWTGSEMIVWGGGTLVMGLNFGGRYDPASNNWKAVNTTGAPPARWDHTAVWTGSEMIVWGGNFWWAESGRFNPAGNSWRAVSPTGEPASRSRHTAIWTGNEMIVWGGSTGSNCFNDGGRYRPEANDWIPVGAASAPSKRRSHTAVWTGSEMIAWGGYNNVSFSLNSGVRFRSLENSLVPVSFTGAPTVRYGHTAVWTGSEMIVWGGYNGGAGPFTLNNGGRYLPATNNWIPVSTTFAPVGRADHTAVWTGSEMIVWGGFSDDALNDGGRYDPAGNNWKAVSTTGAPAARWSHTAVWTGSEMIVWGGTPDFAGGLNTGGRYDPEDNCWTAVSTTGAPYARRDHTAIWTGTQMIVWGGGVFPVSLNDGGLYHPEENRWSPVATTGAPEARLYHTAVWTGDEMIVWGGTPDFFNSLDTGGRYHAAANTWTTVTTTGAPSPRRDHTAVWTGSEMIVWGGWDRTNYFNDTFSYTPNCEVFRITDAVLDSGHLVLSFPSITGRVYTLWRSDTLTSGSWANTGLPALAGTGTILTFTVPAPGATRRFFRVHADPLP